MFNFYQKGIALYLTLILLTIILTIVLGLGTILISQMKTIRGIGYSVIALYAADTGVERVLKVAINDPLSIQPRYPAGMGVETLDNNAGYVVEVFCCDRLANSSCYYEANSCPPPLTVYSTCKAPRYCVRSVGVFKNIKRAIEVEL